MSLKTCLCLEYIDLSTMNEVASYFFNDINIQHVDLKVFWHSKPASLWVMLQGTEKHHVFNQVQYWHKSRMML